MKSNLVLRLGIIFVVMFIGGIVMTVGGISDNSKASKASMDFNYMSKYDFEEGMYVKGRIYEIFDEFAYEESYDETLGIKRNERVSSHYYVVPMVGSWESDTPLYVAVEISHVKTAQQAQTLMEQTWNYYDYDIEPTVWNEFDIVGEVSPLEGELLDYFYEWFMYGDETSTRAEWEPYICPWVIKYHSTDGTANSITFSVIIAAIGAIGLTVMIMLFLRGRGTSAPVQYSAGQQYNYNSVNNTTGYSSNSQDLTDRGFDAPVGKSTYPNADDFFNSGEKHRIPTADDTEPTNGSMPYASAEMPSVSSDDIKSSADDANSEEAEEKDYWQI